MCPWPHQSGPRSWCRCPSAGAFTTVRNLLRHNPRTSVFDPLSEALFSTSLSHLFKRLLAPPSNLLPRFCVWAYTQISPSSMQNGVNGANGGGAARVRPSREDGANIGLRYACTLQGLPDRKWCHRRRLFPPKARYRSRESVLRTSRYWQQELDIRSLQTLRW